METNKINNINDMNMKVNKKGVVAACLIAAVMFTAYDAQAQRTYEEMERLTVNEQVTTVITAWWIFPPIR